MANTTWDNNVLIKKTLTQWNPRKKDEDITQQVTDELQIDTRCDPKFTKLLIVSDAFKEITKINNMITKWFTTYTLPWEDRGYRIMPANFLETALKQLPEFKRQREEAVSRLVDNFFYWKDMMKSLQNGSYKEKDYPTIDELKKSYRFEFDYKPVPKTFDFRVGDPLILEKMQVEFEKDMEEQQKKIEQNCFQRLAEVVEKMILKLEDANTIFRDSLLDNIDDLVKLMPSLNISNNPDLDQVTFEIKEKLLKYSPDELRKDLYARHKTEKAARDIAKKMRGFL